MVNKKDITHSTISDYIMERKRLGQTEFHWNLRHAKILGEVMQANSGWPSPHPIISVMFFGVKHFEQRYI